MKDVLNKNLKFIIGLTLGCIICFTYNTIASSTLTSKDVYYDNTTGMSSSDVQDALDELHALTSSGDASGANILTGFSAIVQGKKVNGTMPNNGALGDTINPGGSYVIPAGYTTGGIVNANPNQNTETYTPTTNGEALDMGVNNAYRYVNTTNVYNEGITYADGRVNSESASYVEGYNNGLSDGSSAPATSTETLSCKTTLNGVGRIKCTLTFHFPHRVLGLYTGNSYVGISSISGNSVTVYFHSVSANNTGSFTFNVTAIGY